MRTFVSLSALALVACSSSHGETIDRTYFDIPACEPGDAQLLDSLTLVDEVDYLEWRSDWGSVGVRGEPCAGATDVTVCQTALASLSAPPDAWQAETSGGAPAPLTFLVYTRGDEVGAVGRSDLPGFLAPIGAPDAVFIAQAATQGHAACDELLVQDVAGGYEVIVTRTQTCGGRVDELRVFVGADGAAEVLETANVAEGEDLLCP